MTAPNMPCDHAELIAAFALGALPADEAAGVQAHLTACAECRQDLKTLQPVVESFAAWPRNVLRPSAAARDKLAQRIVAEAGKPAPAAPAPKWAEPEWENVAPGISCQLLATDNERSRVSMLVRLEPGTAYPPHTHAGVEELHLLEGELWIDSRKLYPGDYNRGEPGGSDKLVWSATGCTCLLITSPRDQLR